jgi:hypothetical protein
MWYYSADIGILFKDKDISKDPLFLIRVGFGFTLPIYKNFSVDYGFRVQRNKVDESYIGVQAGLTYRF